MNQLIDYLLRNEIELIKNSYHQTGLVDEMLLFTKYGINNTLLQMGMPERFEEITLASLPKDIQTLLPNQPINLGENYKLGIKSTTKETEQMTNDDYNF